MKTINDYADLVKEKHALNKTLAPVETDLTSASRAYAIGQKFIYDGILYKAKTAIVQGAALVLNTNYEAADDFSSEIQTLTNNVDVLIDNGAVNKLPNNAITQTIEGIQVTVNADKSITISGSGNGAYFDIFRNDANPIVLEKDCVFSCSAIFTISSCEIVATATDESTYSLKLSTGNKLTIPAGKSIKQVRWYNNNLYDQTLTIYPMIADADYSGGYVPYAMTNRELTDKLLKYVEVENVTTGADGFFVLNSNSIGGHIVSCISNGSHLILPGALAIYSTNEENYFASLNTSTLAKEVSTNIGKVRVYYIPMN